MKTKMGELQTAYSASQKEVVKLTTEVQMKDEDLKQRTNQLEEFLADVRYCDETFDVKREDNTFPHFFSDLH